MDKAYEQGSADYYEGYWQNPYEVGSKEYNAYSDGFEDARVYDEKS